MKSGTRKAQPTESKETSLKRLLALNEPSLDLREALAEAAAILRLPSATDENGSQTKLSAGVDHISHERVEWVLKWLLKNLSGSAESATTARNAFQSWDLLARLLSCAQLRTIAKLLADSDFPSLLETALTGANSLSVISSPSADGLATSKKRKRTAEDASADPQPLSPTLNSLLPAIDRTLTALRGRMESWNSSHATRSEREHLESASRPSVEQSANILRLSQLQLLRLIDSGYRPAITLSNPIWLWSLAISRRATNPQEHALVFSRHCLVSLCQLLVVELQNSHVAVGQATIEEIEKLLVSSIILPARFAYLAAAGKDNMVNGARHVAQTLSVQVLEPLQQTILELGARHERFSNQVKSILQAIPHIWSLALQNPARTTPTRKRLEEPWLTSFFIALADCAGTSVTGDWSIAVHPFSALVLGGIFDACIEFDFPPGTSLLSSAIRRFSGMCLIEEESISWDLIGKALRLGPVAFLPGHPNIENVHEGEDSTPLHQLVIRHLSSMPWKEEFDPDIAAFGLARDNTGTRVPSIEAFKDQNQLSPVEFITVVPVRLLEAYARARDLVSFMSLWRGELTKVTRHIVTGSGKCSVWEDHSLAAALRPLMETHLSRDQILEVIVDFSHPFAELEEAQNIMYIFTELRQNAQGTGAAANLVLLDAIIAALHSEQVIDLVADRLFTLYSNLIHMSARSTFNKLPVMNRVWSILTSINFLSHRAGAAASFARIHDELLATGHHQIALEAIRNGTECGGSVASFDRAVHAADFVLSLHTSDPQSTAAHEAIEACAECFKVTDDMPRYQLAERMLNFPYCWQHMDPAQRRALYNQLYAKATRQSFQGEKSHESQTIDPRYGHVLDAVIELAKTAFSSEAREDLITAISFDIQYLNTSDFESRGVLAEAKLSKFSAAVIPRDLREKCLNSLCRALHAKAQSGLHMPHPVLAPHLSFMIHLMEVPNPTAALYTTHELLLQLATLAQLSHHTDDRVLFEELIRRVKHHTPFKNDLEEELSRSLAQNHVASGSADKRLKLASKVPSTLHACLAMQETVDQSTSARSQQEVHDVISASLLKLSVEDRLGLVADLDRLMPGGELTFSLLLVLELFIKTLPKSIEGHTEFELKSDILARLSAEFATCNKARKFGAVVACVMAIVSERGWLVTQYGIETLIDSLAILTSGSSPTLDRHYAGSIFNQICNVTKTTISVHRIKLHGRFHLLLPLLNNLLRCLFAPHGRAKGPADSRWPSWSQCKESPFTAKHVAAFARLLSTLSSPTVSSASTNKRRRTSSGIDVPLTDETKVARAYVGEYVPPLLAAFCRAQLTSLLPHEVRKVLMPALWSLMETVELEAWRAMSERLSEQERAIWQSVWADWKRVGGGARNQ